MSRAHSGPVFAMFTCLDDGLIVSAGKDTGDGSEGGRGGGGGVGEVKLWTADMSQSRSVSLGRSGGTVIRSVCRSKVRVHPHIACTILNAVTNVAPSFMRLSSLCRVRYW